MTQRNARLNFALYEDMNWKPITVLEIWNLINSACERMTLEQERIWDTIKIMPEKWSEQTYGELGEGFWVVAIIGTNVIWFNDIEDGFNQSCYNKYGEISEYYCNQDRLEHAVQNVINLLKDGYDTAGRASAPHQIT
jgi:hypothetical protein